MATENAEVRAAQDRVRALVLEHGGPKALAEAERHIKASTPHLEQHAREQASRRGPGR